MQTCAVPTLPTRFGDAPAAHALGCLLGNDLLNMGQHIAREQYPCRTYLCRWQFARQDFAAHGFRMDFENVGGAGNVNCVCHVYRRKKARSRRAGVVVFGL